MPLSFKPDMRENKELQTANIFIFSFSDSGGKNLPAVQGMRQGPWVRSLGWEDPLEKEIAAHSSILAWEIPWWAAVHGVAKESDMT